MASSLSRSASTTVYRMGTPGDSAQAARTAAATAVEAASAASAAAPSASPLLGNTASRTGAEVEG